VYGIVSTIAESLTTNIESSAHGTFDISSTAGARSSQARFGRVRRENSMM
jgi:hypothetical protein